MHILVLHNNFSQLEIGSIDVDMVPAIPILTLVFLLAYFHTVCISSSHRKTRQRTLKKANYNPRKITDNLRPRLEYQQA